MRIGQGFDLHRLEEGLPFVLGGVLISSPKGPVGHSDGDALLHAITDAMLGAAALGNIGQHFPDTDPQYKGKSSRVFLEETNHLLKEMGYRVENIDSTVILESPKLAEYILPMRRSVADILKLDPDQVSVKAKTHEELDALGRGEGVAVHAAVLIRKTV